VHCAVAGGISWQTQVQTAVSTAWHGTLDALWLHFVQPHKRQASQCYINKLLCEVLLTLKQNRQLVTHGSDALSHFLMSHRVACSSGGSLQDCHDCC
jgi:hypothetical protein